jgi:hypothetical protein
LVLIYFTCNDVFFLQTFDILHFLEDHCFQFVYIYIEEMFRYIVKNVYLGGMYDGFRIHITYMRKIFLNNITEYMYS